jgi:hypothetical protein
MVQLQLESCHFTRYNGTYISNGNIEVQGLEVR